MSVLTQAQCDSEDGNVQAWNSQGKFFGYKCEKIKFHKDERRKGRCGNDPSAGSPTLRLHLPLNDEV
jgi:hypothetical protein